MSCRLDACEGLRQGLPGPRGPQAVVGRATGRRVPAGRARDRLGRAAAAAEAGVLVAAVGLRPSPGPGRRLRGLRQRDGSLLFVGGRHHDRAQHRALPPHRPARVLLHGLRVRAGGLGAPGPRLAHVPHGPLRLPRRVLGAAQGHARAAGGAADRAGRRGDARVRPAAGPRLRQVARRRRGAHPHPAQVRRHLPGQRRLPAAEPGRAAALRDEPRLAAGRVPGHAGPRGSPRRPLPAGLARVVPRGLRRHALVLQRRPAAHPGGAARAPRARAPRTRPPGRRHERHRRAVPGARLRRVAEGHAGRPPVQQAHGAGAVPGVAQGAQLPGHLHRGEHLRLQRDSAAVGAGSFAAPVRAPRPLKDQRGRMCQRKKGMMRLLSADTWFVVFLASLWVVWRLNQSFKAFTLSPRHFTCTSKTLANVPERFSGFNNTPVRSDADDLLVPNIIHFVRMGEESEEVRPEEAACISAALRSHPGWTVLVHTDRELRGTAWQRLQRAAPWGRLSVQRRPRPQHLFGLPFRDREALHRVTALRVLMKHGGMYVSNSAYLMADLSTYRRYECATLAGEEDPDVMLAHRDARLLQRWLHHFHDAALDWAHRPMAPPHLHHAVDGVDIVMHLKDVDDPEEANVHHEDWYLWTND